MKGKRTVELAWSGAFTDQVRILRDGVDVSTTANDGYEVDKPGKGGGAVTYQVCEAPGGGCSEEVVVTF